MRLRKSKATHAPYDGQLSAERLPNEILKADAKKRLNMKADAKRRLNDVASLEQRAPGPSISSLSIFGVSLFCIYMATLSPGVAGGDSGELLAEACNLGTAHPPGYPLFTMVYHAAMRWPQAFDTQHTPAWRANALSAALAALAATLLASSIVLLTPQQPHLKGPHAGCCLVTITAYGIAALYALSPLVWQYSVTAEVFAMNNCFAATLLHQTLSFARSPTWAAARWGAVLCCLALTNQHTIVLQAAPLALWVLWQRISLSRAEAEPARRTAANAVALAACALAGLLPYAYLPAAALLSPKVSNPVSVLPARN